MNIDKVNLTNAINQVPKEEPTRANEKLLPFWSICKRNPQQRS